MVNVLKKTNMKAKFLLINVLPKALYNDCHIISSINITLEELEQFAQSFNRDSEIALYCAHAQCTAGKKLGIFAIM